ncbi:MAG: tyrosine-type recombinase/integrase [Nitrososphaeraceae archaeon]
MPNKSAATAVSSLNTSKRTKIETARPTDSITISSPEESRALDKYIKNIRAMSKRTAHEYHLRLIGFQDFIIRSYKTTLDGIIRRINEGSEDPYGILSDYVAYLQTNYHVSTLTLKQRVVTVKNFFEYYDVDISPRKFKLKVKIPKVIRKSKEALSKEDIINILNACSEIRLKTYVMLLAGTGLRAVEALSIRIKDLNLQPRPAKIFVRGEYTKTKTDRYVFLTEEVVNQLKQWLDYKHRTRRVCHKDNHTGKTISEYITPQRNDNDLVFAVYQDRNHPNPNAIYFDLVKSFGKTLDRIGKGLREESNNNRRRQITLHSFRRFVKTTISDLGYSDFSEWFIGHAGSTYWTKKDSEKAEIFSKVEPYLTFLNIPELQRQGADIQTKVEELEELNQSLRNRDKMKDDAIAQLSDQLMALTARMQEFERKHTS